MLRDIRELTDSPEAYAAELRRDGAACSATATSAAATLDGPRTGRQHRHYPPGHAQRRPADCCSPCWASPHPRVATCPISRRCPNPVIHSCQILDPGRRCPPHRDRVRGAQAGRQMGYSRVEDRRRRRPRPGAGADRGPGHQHRHTARGSAADGGQSPRDLRLPRPAPAVAGLRRRTAVRTATGHFPSSSVDVASPDAALHIGPQFVLLETAARRPCRGDRRHRPASGRLVARDVPRPRQNRAVPRRNRADARRRRHASPCGRTCLTKATATG